MFDGKSKTRYVGLGKQKDTSKAKLLSDARAQREKRALEKKRTGAAVVIQVYWRRHAVLLRSTQAVSTMLASYLNSATNTSSILESNVPLDTIFSLMRCSVFVFRDVSPRTPSSWLTYRTVLNLVLKSSCSTINSFCLFHVDNFLDDEASRRWQVLVSSFMLLTVNVLSHLELENASPPDTLEVNDDDADKVLSQTSSLVHGFASCVERCPADSAAAALLMGPARAISIALCGFLRGLCTQGTKGVASIVWTSALGSSLPADISSILKFALSYPRLSSGGLGASSASYENLWSVFSNELLSVPRVWRHAQLCPLLENVLGLRSGSEMHDKWEDREEDKDLPHAMSVWRNILQMSSGTGRPLSLHLLGCCRRRPFEALSHAMSSGGSEHSANRALAQDAEPRQESSTLVANIKSPTGPSFLLVNNFFDYAIHRDPSLLVYSSHSTHHWVDMLSRALNQKGVPLIAAINKYHGVADCQKKAKGIGSNSDGDDDDGENDGEDEEDEAEKRSGSRANVGSRDVVNTILEDSVAQTRGRLLRESAAALAASSVSDFPENKRPRLLVSTATTASSGGSGAANQGPTVTDTVELLTYLSNPRVLSAMGEHCAACLASTCGDNSKTSACPDSSDSNMDELLHLLSVLLVNSPAGTNFAGPTRRASLASQMLGVFSFGRFSHQLLEGLWGRVGGYIRAHPGDFIQRFVLETCAPPVSAVSRGLFSPVSATTTLSVNPNEDKSKPNGEHSGLIVMLCVLSHQLLAIDDEEFVLGSKALGISDMCELLKGLKTLLFQMYWTAPVLTTHESIFGSGDADDDAKASSFVHTTSKEEDGLEFLRGHLNNLQLLYIATKVFNQLSIRNERIHFLPPNGWLWTSLGNSELEGLDVDANPFQDQKRTRARMVLLLCPQVIPFTQRAVYFQRLIRNDKAKSRNPQGHHHYSHPMRIDIQRAALFDSTFRTLSRRTPAEWKKNIQVQFINEQGVLESGIDGGGLFKEFIDILLKDMFSTPRSLPLKLPPPLPPSSQSSDQRRGGNDGDRDRDWDSDRSDSESDVRRNVIDLSGGHQVTASVSASGLSEGGDNKEDKKQILNLFLTTATGMLVPNPASLLLDSATSQGALQHYLFMGKMLGKAVYEEILVEPQFSGMFLNHLLGRTNFIDDLVTLDQEIYQSLLKLKRQYLHGGGCVEDLQLTFEVDVATPSGETFSRELMPGGSSVPVTKENLVSYLYLYANFKLNVETYRQSLAFLQGFRELIPTEWMRMFNTSELQLVIGGDNEQGIDLSSLQRLCTYSGGYHPSQPYIQAFWGIMESLSPADQGEFLRFVTSCSRPPLLGYGQFNPPFNIMKISADGGGGAGSKRLPMAASCFNQFKLPQYDTVEELREKLLYSIQSKSGFELS